MACGLKQNLVGKKEDRLCGNSSRSSSTIHTWVGKSAFLGFVHFFRELYGDFVEGLSEIIG